MLFRPPSDHMKGRERPPLRRSQKRGSPSEAGDCRLGGGRGVVRTTYLVHLSLAPGAGGQLLECSQPILVLTIDSNQLSIQNQLLCATWTTGKDDSGQCDDSSVDGCACWRRIERADCLDRDLSVEILILGLIVFQVMTISETLGRV